jgi:TPR repeat protein
MATNQPYQHDVKNSLTDSDSDCGGVSLVIDVHTPYANSTDKMKTLTLSTTLTHTVIASLSSGSILRMAHKAICSVGANTVSAVSSSSQQPTSHTRSSSSSSSSNSCTLVALEFADEKNFMKELSLSTQASEVQSVSEEIECPPDHGVIRRVYLYVRPGCVTLVGKVPRWMAVDSFNDTLHDEYKRFDARARQQFIKLNTEWKGIRDQSRTQYDIGCLFEKGEKESSPDLQIALKWFRMAAKQGHDGALVKVKELTLSTHQVTGSIKDVLKLHEDGKISHDEAVTELSRVLARAPAGFEELDLSNCGIGDAGARAIAGVLAQSSLTYLNIGENSIGDIGARAIAAVLDNVQCSLKNLRLSINCIGDAGAEAIAGVLAQSSLTTLTLSNNPIGDAGAGAIAAVLSQSNLTDLTIYSKLIGDAMKETLQRAGGNSCDIGV